MNTFLLTLLTSIVFLVSNQSLAEDFQTRILIDKTFVHDNSYCRLNNKSVEIEIRSFDKYTEPGDSEYGEHVFALQAGKKRLLPLNKDNVGRYKLFKGRSDYCSKSLALPVNDDVLAIFFLRDNRPLGDLLSVLFYNLKTFEIKLIETVYSTDRATIQQGKFKFPLLHKKKESPLGKVTINEIEFIFQERSIRPWLVLNGETFQIDNVQSYEKSELQKHFQTQNDFEKNFAWDQKTKEYLLNKYYYAINHKEKVECLAVPYDKKMDLSSHKWRCQKI